MKVILCAVPVYNIKYTANNKNSLASKYAPGSERGSLQSPFVTSHGIHQLSLGPALKKYVKQIEGVKRRAASFIENGDAGTRNSYQPLERVKLDTAEDTKNNQEQSRH